MAVHGGTSRRWTKRLAPLVAVVVASATLAVMTVASPAAADVTAVKGSAFGYYADVSLFGGPSARRGAGQVICTSEFPEPSPPGCTPAATAPLSASPSVTLPPSGGTASQTDHDGAEATYGPATIFGGIWPAAVTDAPPSGPISVSSQGTTGLGGSVTSSVDIVLYNPPRPAAPGGVGPGPFEANELHSTCTATETGVTASTTFVNGILTTSTDANGEPVNQEPVPSSPPVNYTRTGTIDNVGDSFRAVFNEQVRNSDGSLTVNAYHLYLLGPTAVGEMVVGSSTCGVTAADAGRYTPLTPARILDTRYGTGGIAGAVGPGSTVEVQVAGRGGVPASGASAVAMNVTVTQPTATGWLTLFPTGAPLPLAANLNFTPGKTVPNLVVVKLGTGGKVSLFNSHGSSHVIFDVAGWYTSATGGNAGRLQPLVPARILDTRDGTGGGMRLGPGATLDMQVSGRGGVPATGVQAAVLQVAVTGTTATSFLTIYPTGEARPLAANLNFNAGDTVSNRAMVKLGSGGRVSIFNHAGSTDVVVDVGGWYTDGSVAGTGGGYNALVPARILDTRDGTGGIAGARPAGSTSDVQITGRGGVPASGVSAVVLNATVTGPAAPGWLTLFPAGAPRPLAADLNYSTGETRPNLVVVRVGTGGRVSLFTSASTHVIFDVAGWFSEGSPAV